MLLRVYNRRGPKGRSFLYVSTMLCSGLAAPALAQSDTPARARQMLDENGVNLSTGEHVIYDTVMSIGPAAPSGLSLVRGYGRYSGGSSQYDLGIYQVGSVWHATVGFKSYLFSLSGTTFTSTDGSGATLTKSGTAYTLVAPDGTTYLYNYTLADTNDVQRKSRVSRITYPTGEILTMTWAWASWCTGTSDECGIGVDGVRLQAVSSSLGYQLHYNYQNNNPITGVQGTNWRKLISVQAINTAVNACDPAAIACTGLTQTWPTATFSGTSVTDPLGRTTTYTASGLNYTLKRPGSSTATYVVTYDSAGKVASVANEGVTWTYNYSVAGNVATMIRTAPGGTSRTIISDLSVGLPTSIKNELNQTTSYQYDGSGRLTRVTAPEGNYVQYGYDGRGNVTQTTSVAKSGSGLANIAVTAGYPASCTTAATCNKPEWTRDAKGNQTDYTYDPTHGNVISVKAPAPTAGAVRPETRYGYTSISGVYRLTSISSCQTTASCTGGADEVKTTIGYDAKGQVTSVSKGAGNGSLTATTTATYDAVGNLLTVDGPLAGTADTTRYRYDAGRQRVGVVGPDPDGTAALLHRATRYSYNADGQRTLTQLGTVVDQSDTSWANFAENYRVTNVYDANARMNRQTLWSNGVDYAVTDYVYDTLGRPSCGITYMDPAQWGPLASSCTPLQTNGPNGPDRVTRTSYNEVGRVKTVETAVGTADASVEVTNGYTANGQLGYVMDGESNLTAYEYDGHDRLVTTRYPVPSPVGYGVASTTDYEQLTLDANGNVTTRRLRDGKTITLAYDNLNRLISRDLPNDAYGEYDFSYSYDNLGRAKTISSSAGHVATMNYDALNRLTSEESYFGGKSFQYDLAGRRTRLTWPDNFYVTYDYLVTGEMTAIKENGSVSLATFAYDDLGRRTSLTRGNGTVTSYGYDPVSRLSSLTHDLAGTAQDLTLGFSYNPASQIASNTRSNDVYAWGQHYNVDRPYGVNGLNQLTTAGSVVLGYDGRGNLNNAQGVGYLYTVDNVMTYAGGRASLLHDPLNRLMQSYDQQSGLYTRFDHVGSELISELSGGNTLLRRYVHGPGTDEPLVWYEGAGTGDKRWLHTDERGSIVAVTNSAGAAIAINAYDEYGIPASTNLGRFQYTGQTWIPELGMYYYKARIYSPTLGRFMQTDPIDYGDGMNLYAYVGNDPVNFVDPTGLCGGNRNTAGDIEVCGGKPGIGAGGSPSGSHGGGLRDPGEEKAEQIEEMDEIVVNGAKLPKPQNEEPQSDDIVVTGERLAQLVIPMPGRRISPMPPWVFPEPDRRNNSLIPLLSEEEKKKRRLKENCIKICSPLLERDQPPGADWNTWDFHKCVRQCIAFKGKPLW